MYVGQESRIVVVIIGFEYSGQNRTSYQGVDDLIVAGIKFDVVLLSIVNLLQLCMLKPLRPGDPEPINHVLFVVL
jgi:hypothetical protein